MKKLFVGLTALTGAVIGSAFAAHFSPPDDVWFRLNPVTGNPRTDLAPTLAKPACPGAGAFCARKYTSYTEIGSPAVYTPGNGIPNTTSFFLAR